MTRFHSLLALAALALAAPSVAGAAAASSDGPMAQLKQTNDKLDRILKSKPAAGSSAEKQAKEDLKRIANDLLDYHELAKRALKQHWTTLTPAQREEFVTTLRDMIEKRYVQQLRTHLDYQVSYKHEDLGEGDATVATVVKVKTKGKSSDVQVDYKLHKVGERWEVFDVITDEVSMVQNYARQFHKILTEKGYDELVKKMKQKTEETDETKPGE
jgi:phospholipid transport system substrate-binding protein